MGVLETFGTCDIGWCDIIDQDPKDPNQDIKSKVKVVVQEVMLQFSPEILNCHHGMKLREVR